MRGIPPERLPNDAWWWAVQADAAQLHYNYGCVAYIVRINGKLHTVIRWQGRMHEARCGSLAQGMRWIERWIEKRKGWPTLRPERWYDRVDRERRERGRGAVQSVQSEPQKAPFSCTGRR